MINYYFDPETVQKILKTPLFYQVEEDQLIWRAEKNGHYSVRSAYRICMEEIAGNSHLHRAGNWDNIWRIKVPPKVKNLIWRVCRNCLPTRARLLDKGVHCPFCVLYAMRVMRIHYMYCLTVIKQGMCGGRAV